VTASWPTGRSLDGGIDRIPLPVAIGGLSLCGKHAVGPDVEAAIASAGADVVVCLNERHELVARYPDYVDWLRTNAGERAVWFPIPDLYAPSLAVMRPMLDGLIARIHRGEHLLMHCGAGIGRAGTTATCLLMLLGHSQGEALKIVADNRPMGGPEVGSQRDLVNDLAAQLGDNRGT
jgi:protein tyrosine phosphatase